MGTWDTCTTITPNTWQVMQEYLPNKLLRRYRNLFNKLDRSCTGVVCVKDVAVVLKQNGHAHGTEFINNILKSMACCNHDAINNYKFVDFSEFLVIMSASAKKCIPEDEILQIFNIFDQDGDGFIGREELRNLLSKLGDEVSEKEVEEMIEEADRDGDGLVSYHEFVRIITNSIDNPACVECEKNSNILEENGSFYLEGDNCFSEDAVFSDDQHISDDNCFDENCNFSSHKTTKKRLMRRSLRGSISWLSKITSRKRVWSNDKYNKDMYCNLSSAEKSMTLPSRPHKSCENILDSYGGSTKNLKSKKHNFSMDNLKSLTLRKKNRNFSTADIL